MNILFVSTGNLCRSPLAEAILKKKFADHRINGEVDSAGFESFNINEPPHTKTIEIGKRHGIEVTGKARLFVKDDFIRFDRIYVMDVLSYDEVMDLTRSDKKQKKVDYLMNVINPGKNEIIEDPVDSGRGDCEAIFDLFDIISDKLIEELK
ncbi:MAG: protein-tyrosine-phosphatase [Bacteroidetes bacterium HGW-Bacteroidetes-16]|jgi:protein-tyrosine phosphatase|nr:MAG: protein-tyrosine-phosphatase [Bacteroidetes bacterium HGW-Bacteroidetes-16]